MSDPDDANDANDEQETSSSEEAAPRKKRSSARNKARLREERVSASKPAQNPARVVLVGVVALAFGAAGGWFGHEAQAKAKLRADSAPATAGSGAASGPCAAWEQKICAGSGDQSAACHQAKSATELLTSGTCERALETMPATLAKLKAARVPCDTLVGKLCADLPPGSQACALVKERTPSFPSERCTEMLQNYDAVIGELKTMDQQMGAAPPGGAPMGQPMGQPMVRDPRGAPPGAP
ncbi:MAG TPA: hypothetical protein VGI10_02790 [Polyangiaceae bacterium]|jgi:hypothetical protein